MTKSGSRISQPGDQLKLHASISLSLYWRKTLILCEGGIVFFQY